MWEISDQERKKNLKIQERSGISIGLASGFRQWKPYTLQEPAKTIETLKMVYKYGLKSFVLAEDMLQHFGLKNQITTANIYKDLYMGLLEINRNAKKYKIELSLHSSKLLLLQGDAVAREKAHESFMVSCHLSRILDGRIFTIHPGSFGNLYEREVIRSIAQELMSITDSLKVDTPIGIETTGKLSEIGSLEHVIEIVGKTEQTEPVINFGHLHARGSGSLRLQTDFAYVLDRVEQRLGPEYLKNPFFYFTPVSYGPSGETGHVSMARSDLKFEHLARELQERGIRGTVVVDSTDRETDCLQALKIMENVAR